MSEIYWFCFYIVVVVDQEIMYEKIGIGKWYGKIG